MPSRTSLKDRKAQDIVGVDAIIPVSTDLNGVPDNEEQVSRQNLAKVTLYIRPDQVLAIEEIQLGERKRTGKRKDKSDLVQEAIDLLITKYSEL